MLCTCSSWQPCAAGGGDSPRPLSVSRTRLISTRWVFRPVSITPSVLPISVVRKLCWRSVCIIKGIRTRPLSSGAAERGDARNHASDWPLAHVMFMRRCHGAKVVWKKVLRSVETKIELGIKRSIWQNPPEWSVVVVASCYHRVTFDLWFHTDVLWTTSSSSRQRCVHAVFSTCFKNELNGVQNLFLVLFMMLFVLGTAR